MGLHEVARHVTPDYVLVDVLMGKGMERDGAQAVIAAISAAEHFGVPTQREAAIRARDALAAL